MSTDWGAFADRAYFKATDILLALDPDTGVGVNVPASALVLKNAAGQAFIGATPPATGAGVSLWLGDSLTFAAGGERSLIWNGYYVGSSWKHLTSGYMGTIAYNPADGYFRVFQSSASGVADASVTALNVNLSIDPAGSVNSRGAYFTGNLYMQGDGANGYIRTTNGTSTLFLGSDNTNYLGIDGNKIYPTTDNRHSLGHSGVRYTTVYAVTGTINTSDEREKRWLGDLTPQHIEAARRIAAEIGTYQWLDALTEKGDGARIHYGARAQRVIQIFMDLGLERSQRIDFARDLHMSEADRPTFKHAFICFDTWADQLETEFETYEEVTPIFAASAIVDARGAPAQKQIGEERRTLSRPTGRQIVRTPAGNRFGLRVDQLLLFMLACQERRLAALEKAA